MNAPLAHPKFLLGRVVVTPGVIDAVPHDEMMRALDRHARGDWGDLDAEDIRENELSRRRGLRLLSVYTSAAGVRFWIVTEADRSATTLLLPEEYRPPSEPNPFERAPEDTTMDVHCCNCGEPWDQYHLCHELAGMTPEELTANGWRVGTSRLAVLHCPCCPKDGPGLPGAELLNRVTRSAAGGLRAGDAVQPFQRDAGGVDGVLQRGVAG